MWHLPYPRGTSNFLPSDLNFCSDLRTLVQRPLHLGSLGMRPKKVNSQWPLFRTRWQVKRMATARIHERENRSHSGKGDGFGQYAFWQHTRSFEGTVSLFRAHSTLQVTLPVLAPQPRSVFNVGPPAPPQPVSSPLPVSPAPRPPFLQPCPCSAQPASPLSFAPPSTVPIAQPLQCTAGPTPPHHPSLQFLSLSLSSSLRPIQFL